MVKYSYAYEKDRETARPGPRGPGFGQRAMDFATWMMGGETERRRPLSRAGISQKLIRSGWSSEQARALAEDLWDSGINSVSALDEWLNQVQSDPMSAKPTAWKETSPERDDVSEVFSAMADKPYVPSWEREKEDRPDIAVRPLETPERSPRVAREPVEPGGFGDEDYTPEAATPTGGGFISIGGKTAQIGPGGRVPDEMAGTLGFERRRPTRPEPRGETVLQSYGIEGDFSRAAPERRPEPGSRYQPKWIDRGGRESPFAAAAPYAGRGKRGSFMTGSGDQRDVGEKIASMIDTMAMTDPEKALGAYQAFTGRGGILAEDDMYNKLPPDLQAEIDIVMKSDEVRYLPVEQQLAMRRRLISEYLGGGQSMGAGVGGGSPRIIDATQDVMGG